MTPENIDHLINVVEWTVAGILILLFLVWLSKHASSTYSSPTPGYSVPERSKFLQPYNSTWSSTTFSVPEGTKEVWVIEHSENSRGSEGTYTTKKVFLTKQAAYDAMESTREEIIEERNLPWNSQAYADVYDVLRVRKVNLDGI